MGERNEHGHPHPAHPNPDHPTARYHHTRGPIDTYTPQTLPTLPLTQLLRSPYVP
jgi:hypothetical protein